jgi:hypothetical protein
VVIGRPLDLIRIIKIDKPDSRVYYHLQEIGRPNFKMMLDDFTNNHLKIFIIFYFNFLPQNAANPSERR